MPISVDLPDALVTRFPSLFRAFAQLAERVAALVDSPPASFAVAEVELTAATDALAVEGVGLVLRALDPTVEVVEVEGKRYRRLADAGRCRYFGLRGPVEVERHLYREIGVRNGPTIVPLDLKAGVGSREVLPVRSHASPPLDTVTSGSGSRV